MRIVVGSLNSMNHSLKEKYSGKHAPEVKVAIAAYCMPSLRRCIGAISSALQSDPIYIGQVEAQELSESLDALSVDYLAARKKFLWSRPVGSDQQSWKQRTVLSINT